MPSPFPGMDPFLEDNTRWSDFHPTLIVVLRRVLSHLVSPHFHVDIQEQVYIAEPDEEPYRSIVPDVFVTGGNLAGSTNAIVTEKITSPTIEAPLHEDYLYPYLEIRDAHTKGVVAIIEVLSPGIKTPDSLHLGSFLEKRAAVMASHTHWLEIDLLRGGKRPADVRRPSDYYALLKRTGVADRLEVWYFDLRDTMPVIAVPLRPPFDDVPLNLEQVFTETFQDGFYEMKLDYDGPIPSPRLRPAEAAWARERVAAWRVENA